MLNSNNTIIKNLDGLFLVVVVIIISACGGG